MDLVFDGRTGRMPPPDSVEFMVLEACADRRAWGGLKALEPGDFERAIERLRGMGWGFAWATLQ